MKEPRHDLGVATLLKPEALGAPGKRTFRILVEAERGAAVIWMEKEQLSALALAIKRLLGELAEQRVRGGAPPPGGSRKEPMFDFKAGSLALAYDERRRAIGLLASDPKDAEGEQATLACWTSRERADSLADEALQVAAAGRPVCVLCKQPINPDGHWCFRANGHKGAPEEL